MKEPKRIAFVCDTVLPWIKGGRQRRLLEIVKRLRRPGRELHIYTMNWWNGPKCIEVDGIYYHALCRYYPIYKGERRSIFQGIMFSLSIFNLLFEQFDVLDVDHMPFFPLYSARVVAWFKGVPLTATWHEVWGHQYWQNYLGSRGGSVAYLVEKMSFALPDRIISVSPHTTEGLRANGVACPIETIANCVDLQTIAAVAPAEIESDIIYVGRLMEHKGVYCLIEAIGLMRQARPRLRAVLLGGGPEEAKITQLIHNLGLEKNVQLLGAIDDDSRPYALMKSSKVLVLPSRREGFGLVVLEAFAAGIPVVTTSEEANAGKALIKDKINGRIAAANADDLREKIEYVLEMRTHMRPSEGLEQYDWSVAARQYERLFEAELAASG